jgi:Fe-Mn family superoxide dismutase
VWLVSDASGALKIISTHDAESPVTQDLTALLVCDVWEHAYYLDYQNPEGLPGSLVRRVPNWTLADSQYAAAKGGRPGLGLSGSGIGLI